MYDYEVLLAKNQFPTIRIMTDQRTIYLHSRYDPIKEAEKFAEEYYDAGIDRFVVVGFAFGYHIEALRQRLQPQQSIYVLENQQPIMEMTRILPHLANIWQSPQIIVYEEYDVRGYIARFNQLMEEDQGEAVRIQLLIYQPSLQTFPSHMEQVRELLEDYRINALSMKHAADSLLHNFVENINNYQNSVDIVFSAFSNIPVILVAAGPSLDKNIHLLKECENRAVIITVGRAAKALIAKGIKPNFIVITESKPNTYLQIEGLAGIEDIPVVVISTADKDILQQYPGKKLIAFQDDFVPAELYAKEHGCQTVETGGSVATLAFDIAVRFGGNPIIFVGQDLAYTDGRTHTTGTWHQTVENAPNMRVIPGYHGGAVKTIRNLHIYLKWFERQIRLLTSQKTNDGKNKRIFINATEGGARIEGTIQMTLQEVIERILPNEYIDVARIVSERMDKNISNTGCE